MGSSELKKAGLKSTVPRMQILELLLDADNKKHLSAEDVYKILLSQDKDTGLATVYRVLTQFEQAGLVRRHHFDGIHSIFELDEGDHHDHLVCLKCGKVEEFFDDDIEQLQHKIAKKYDFTMSDHSLYLYGKCSDCKAS
jgi:Fur family transcriptional regulator, ferric uptake regulator